MHVFPRYVADHLFIENHPRYAPVLAPFFAAADAGKVDLVTSTLTLTEVLVHPLRQGNTKLANAYRTILTGASGLELRQISSRTAEFAAQFRARYVVKTPDALQLASALDASASVFLSNDQRLPHVDELRLVLLDEVIASQ